MTSTNTSTNNGKRSFPWGPFIAIAAIITIVVILIIVVVMTLSSGSKTASASDAPSTSASPSPSPSPDVKTEGNYGVVLYSDLQKELNFESKIEFLDDPKVTVSDGLILYDGNFVLDGKNGFLQVKSNNINIDEYEKVYYSVLKEEYDLKDESELFDEKKVPQDKVTISPSPDYFVFYENKLVMDDSTESPFLIFRIDCNNRIVILPQISNITTERLEVQKSTALNGTTNVSGSSFDVNTDTVDITAKKDINITSDEGNVTISAPKGEVTIEAPIINLKGDIHAEDIWADNVYTDNIWSYDGSERWECGGGSSGGGGSTSGGGNNNNDWSQDDDSWGDGGSSGGGNNNSKTYYVSGGYSKNNGAPYVVLRLSGMDSSCTIELDGVTHYPNSDGGTAFVWEWTDLQPGTFSSYFVVYDSNHNVLLSPGAHNAPVNADG